MAQHIARVEDKFLIVWILIPSPRQYWVLIGAKTMTTNVDTRSEYLAAKHKFLLKISEKGSKEYQAISN